MRLTIQQSRVVLGVSSEATSDQVRQAYRKLALQFHPDKNPDPSATEKFQQLSAAYKRLCDHEQRRRGNGTGSSNQHTHGSESEDASGSGGDDDSNSDFDDMDISFDEMLMMFEMMFGSAAHGGSRVRRKSPAATTAKKTTTSPTPVRRAPQVCIARRGGRGGVRRGGGRGGFAKAPMFGSAEEMLFESFMAMEMTREMNDLEEDFKAMSTLFGDAFGDAGFSLSGDDDDGDDDGSICSDNDLFAMEDLPGFARAMGMSSSRGRSTRTRQRSVGRERKEPSSGATQEPNDKAETKEATPEVIEASPSDASPIELDANVRVFGKLTGVVKFKGSVHYAKGDFVGVQLSEPLGKNDGTVKGVAYFACPPQCGLMVRPEDVALVK